MNKVMGIGTFYLMVAGVITLGANFFLHIFLAHYLTPELYGIFGILMSFYMINSTFLSTGVVNAVSKFISEAKFSYSLIFNASLKIQLIFSAVFTGLYFIFAGKIAALFGEPSLKNYLLVLTLMIIPFTLLSLYWNGYLNGLRLFKKQALISILHPTLKSLFACFLVFLGFKLYGVLVGLLLSILISLAVCIFFIKIKTKSIDLSSKDIFNQKKCLRKLFYFSLPLMISSLIFTLLRNVNLLFIKYLLKDNFLVAIYTAANTFANVPILIFTALFFTLIPSVSNSLSAQNYPLARKYVSSSFRYLLLLLFPLAALVVPTSTQLVTLFYPLGYASAGNVLSILIISSILLVIMTSLMGVIIGLGKPKAELFIGIILLLLLSLLNMFLIPKFKLMGAAYSILITMFFAALISGVYVYKKLSFSLPFSSILNITLASIFIFSIGLVWKSSGFLLLVQYSILILIYLMILFLFKEFNPEDYDFIKRIFKFN